MARKPIIWLILMVLFIGGTIYSVNFFDKANPIVNLDIQMDRQSALKKAVEISEKYHLGPDYFKAAASFSLDGDVKNYVELEIGGAEAFNKMIAGDIFSPYTWKVRHFKPEEANETIIRFTPEGKFYGFTEKIPEDRRGKNVPADSARILVESYAKAAGINLNNYELIEDKQETLPSDRQDHTFVYERKIEKLGDASYRLKLKLSGSKFSELTHFVKIPEAFTREYDEMRSTNNTLAAIATAAGAILYILGGVIFGLFIMLKKNWVIWKTPLYWGLFVAALQVLVQINNWPLMWMNYDTALASQGFLMQQIVQLLILFLAEALLLTLSFMAAETLSRKAFPNHIQLWKIWSKDVANSKAVYGQTLGGFLAVSIFFAFDISLYFFTTKVLGWWVPSSTLFDPNILATYFPWFSSIANSLHAGFWEECLFRAIPIAGAALLGNKFGKQKIWIAAAFVIQALIFGAAHANYPMQPSYARVIELIIPSVAFGLMYLYFGLLPGIILHYAYDVVWMSLPLFASSASGLLPDKIIVIILTFVPVIILIWRRIQAGKTVEVSEKALNKTWQPAEKTTVEIESPSEAQPGSPKGLSKNFKIGLIAVALAGLVVWFTIDHFTNYASPIETNRKEAVSLAKNYISQQGISLSDSIKILSNLVRPLDLDDRFIWQEYGEKKYNELIGNYLHNPYWLVRFARFEGNVASRAEEHFVYIEQGEVVRYRHKLPETAAGDSLSEEAARKIAHNFILKNYKTDPGKLKEVTAAPSTLPNRRDWTFEYADTTNYKLTAGEPQIAVTIAGSNVVDAYKKIHVPEQWERDEKSRNNSRQIIKIVCIITYVLLFITGLILAIVFWSKGKFSLSVFLPALVLLIMVFVLSFINSWPKLLAQMNTALPLSNQKTTFIISGFISALLAFVPALVLGFIKNQKENQSEKGNILTIICGFSIGVILSTISVLIMEIFGPSLQPFWAEYGAFADSIPIISAGLTAVQGLFMKSAILLFIFWLADKVSGNWTKNKALAAIIIIAFGLILSGTNISGISIWLISGLVLGIIYLMIYLFILQTDFFLIVLVVAGNIILGLMKNIILQAYPAAIPENIIAISLTVILAILLYKKLSQKTS